MISKILIRWRWLRRRIFGFSKKDLAAFSNPINRVVDYPARFKESFGGQLGLGDWLYGDDEGNWYYLSKEIERIKFYCKPLRYTYYKGVKYEGIPKDASKKPTPANLNFIKNSGIILESKNEFYSLKILDSREGTSFYFYIGVEAENQLVFLQIRADEITSVFPSANMVDGNIIGNFKFVQSGSHTRIRVAGNQNLGHCKYWLKEYSKYNIFSKEENEGLNTLTEGGKEDINLALIMIEAKKSEYYKLKFEKHG